MRGNAQTIAISGVFYKAEEEKCHKMHMEIERIIINDEMVAEVSGRH